MFPSRRITMGGDVFRDEFSLAFDGSNDHLNIGNPSTLQLGEADITFAFWYKPTADSGYLISKRDGAAGLYSVFHESDGQHRFYIGNDSSVGANFGSAVPLGVWNHLVMTFDLSTTTLTKYVNGKFDAVDTSATGSNINDDEAWRINGRFGVGDAMTGNSDATVLSMSDVAIYNKALSASEVATLYNGREPYNHKEGICSSNLKAWWRMGDGGSDGYRLISDQSNTTFGADIIEANTADLGSFDTDTTGNWTVQNESSWTWNSGTGDATFVADAGVGGNAINKSLLTVGQSYKLTFRMKSTNRTAAPSIYYGTAEGYTVPEDGKTLSTEYQTFTHHFVATQAKLYIAGGVGIGDGKDFTVDDIIVRPANGSSAIMTNMDADDFEGDTP